MQAEAKWLEMWRKVILCVLNFRKDVPLSTDFFSGLWAFFLFRWAFVSVFCVCLAVNSFAIHSVFGSSNKQSTKATTESAVALNAWVIIFVHFLPFVTKRQHETAIHSAYSRREREQRRPIFITSFSNFDAVFIFRFRMSMAVINQLNDRV